MRKLIALSTLALVFGCSPKNHKVTFDFQLESTNGKESLVMECYKAKEVRDYIASQSKAFMEGKASTMTQPVSIGKYDSKGTPPNDLKFTIELPEEEVTCGTSAGQFITMRKGEDASPVFKPLADTTLKVSYNMYTKSFYKADSQDAKITLVKY